jgi:flagellar basal-body rod protein FlgB
MIFHDNTIELITQALNAAVMRQTAIAINVANTNTQNYHTIDVNFEQQLNGLSQSTEDEKEMTLANLKPLFEQRDTNSSLDEQIALGVRNATQYRALIKGINHKLAIMKLALQGNNQS